MGRMSWTHSLDNMTLEGYAPATLPIRVMLGAATEHAYYKTRLGQKFISSKTTIALKGGYTLMTPVGILRSSSW